MRSFVTIAGIATLASTAIAGTLTVKNNCAANVFLTITRSDQSSAQYQLASGGASYSEPISGQGNSYGLTTTADYYSASTPKLILGLSDSPPTVYYSVSNVNGNPFAGQSFSVSASDASCGVVTTADGSTHTCADSNDFTLTAC